MRVALPVNFKKTLVIPGSSYRITVIEFDSGQGPGLTRVLKANFPFFTMFATQCHDIPADIDQSIMGSVLLQDFCSTINTTVSPTALEIPKATIERYPASRAAPTVART